MNTDFKSKLQGSLAAFIFALLMAGKKIQVIKQIKEACPMGLKEAKDFTEETWYSHFNTSDLDLNKVSGFFGVDLHTLSTMGRHADSGEVTQLRGLLAAAEAKCHMFEEQHNDAIQTWRSDYNRLGHKLLLAKRERDAFRELYEIAQEANDSQE